MPSRLDEFDSPSGRRFGLTIIPSGGSLNADASPDALGDDEYSTLKNWVTHLPGPAKKRGAITNSGTNSTDINDATGVLEFYNGPKVSGATYRPYFGTCLDGSNVEYYVQTESSSRELGDSLSSGGYGVPVSKCPTVDGWLVMPGRDVLNTTDTNCAALAVIYGGATASVVGYTTGTVTVASGSTTVTGSGTTWTAAMEGMAFYVIGDLYGYAFYRVKKVVSSTSLTLDRNYAGSVTGAGKNYGMRAAQILATSEAGPFGQSGTFPRFKIAASCWGRLVAASTREAGPSAAVGNTTPEYPSRIRWSALLGASEGSNAAISGIYAWNAAGYIDLAAKFGEIIALAPTAGSLVVFQESGMTEILGAPTYDGIGSLDASEVYPSVAINGGFAFESTPLGVFFFDKNVGPCRFDGTRVSRLADKRLTRTMLASHDIKHVGYYDGKVLFSSDSNAAIFAYDTASDSWTQHTPPAAVKCLIAGRVENNEDVVGLAGGTQVVNLANMFDNPGDDDTDYDGTAIICEMITRHFGNHDRRYQPDYVRVTYKLTDVGATNPYFTVDSRTGLPGATNSNPTASTDFTETTTPETRHVSHVSSTADNMLSLRLLQVNGAGAFEVYRVYVEGSVIGDQDSN